MSQGGLLSNNSGTSSTVDFLTGNSGGAVAPDASHNINVVGSGGVVVTGNPGTNTLTITSGSGFFSWQNISASQALVAGNGYFCSGGAALALSLPAVSAVGDTIKIALIGSSSFTITQAALQQIVIGSHSTTVGVGGSVASTAQGDFITIVCQTANKVWVAEAPEGNLTIV